MGHQHVTTIFSYQYYQIIASIMMYIQQILCMAIVTSQVAWAKQTRPIHKLMEEINAHTNGADVDPRAAKHRASGRRLHCPYGKRNCPRNSAEGVGCEHSVSAPSYDNNHQKCTPCGGTGKRVSSYDTCLTNFFHDDECYETCRRCNGRGRRLSADSRV